jgi:hypothetical protein
LLGSIQSGKNSGLSIREIWPGIPRYYAWLHAAAGLVIPPTIMIAIRTRPKPGLECIVARKCREEARFSIDVDSEATFPQPSWHVQGVDGCKNTRNNSDLGRIWESEANGAYSIQKLSIRQTVPISSTRLNGNSWDASSPLGRDTGKERERKPRQQNGPGRAQKHSI